MSVILRTIQAFPRGRTTEELLALTATGFDARARLALVAELEGLAAEGRVRLRPDGRWVEAGPARLPSQAPSLPRDNEGGTLRAAPFQRQASVPAEAPTEATDDRPDPRALLRYWRSALRADPRGAITEMPDRHGAMWHLVSGKGPLVPEAGQDLVLTLPLDGLSADFRTALLRREGNENALALGWPLAVGRRLGVTAIWPVGLLAAEWRREGDQLEVRVAADDVTANPDWIKGTARATGWTGQSLAEIFQTEDGVGLEAAEFLARLREAMASSLRGKVTGDWLAGELDPARPGIVDGAALFLPDDSSFTAGAVRDLDTVATWDDATLASTAVGPLLGLDGTRAQIPALNVGPLNAEQIGALRRACTAPLSVITGPPGTGKSQVIVSIAASVLMAGGSVLVASRNHQALDAVEDRLGALAPEVPFVVRTLDGGDSDRSFASVLAEMVQGETRRVPAPEESLDARLAELSRQRSKALDQMQRRDELECQIAEVLERMAARERFGAPEPEPLPPSFGQRLLALFRRGPVSAPDPLAASLADLRRARDGLGPPPDAVALTEEVTALAQGLIAPTLASRAHLSPQAREALDQAKADADLVGRKLPRTLAQAILAHRPLWCVFRRARLTPLAG